MKKRLLFFFTLTLNCFLQSYGVEINGIYYSLDSSTNQAEVAESPYNNKYSGDIDIPSTVTYEGKTFDVTKIGLKAFYECQNVTSLSIPNSVTVIGSRAFEGCNLKTIVIPNSVTFIASKAFLNCFELKTITMGTGIIIIEESAFSNCTCLEKVIVKDLTSWCGIYFESMGSNPLYNANHLYSNEETEITELVIPNGVESISRYAFFGCKHIKSLSIPSSVKEIQDAAFADCVGLTNINIPNSVTFLSGFSYCSNLTSVTITNSVTEIGSGAFTWCSALTSVEIPNSVTWIHDYAFWGCEKMKSIILGSKVKTIEENAFYKCYALADVYCYAEKVPLTRNKPFDKSLIKNTTLHVPDSLVESYKAVEQWKDFKEIVAIPSSGIHQVNTNSVSVKNEGDQLTVEGVDDAETIEVYSMDGTKRGSAISKNGVAQINTNLKHGNVGIVKINNKSVKVIIK